MPTQQCNDYWSWYGSSGRECDLPAGHTGAHSQGGIRWGRSKEPTPGERKLIAAYLADGTVRVDHAPGKLNQPTPAARLLGLIRDILRQSLTATSQATQPRKQSPDTSNPPPQPPA